MSYKIDFLSTDGEIAETIFYKNKKEFQIEIKESNYVGRPIKYKEQEEELER